MGNEIKIGSQKMERPRTKQTEVLFDVFHACSFQGGYERSRFYPPASLQFNRMDKYLLAVEINFSEMLTNIATRYIAFLRSGGFSPYAAIWGKRIRFRADACARKESEVSIGIPFLLVGDLCISAFDISLSPPESIRERDSKKTPNPTRWIPNRLSYISRRVI